MQFAVDRHQTKIRACPGREGWCPICKESLQPRCGEINVWHWAHEARHDCDPWWEPETDWHRSWKSLVPDDRTEVAMDGHRADIVGLDGAIIELQHSSISPAEIQEREAFYGRMVWLIDGAPFLQNLRVIFDETQCRFVWARSRPCWFAARMPRFIHGFSVGRYVRTEIPGQTHPRWVWKPSGTSDGIFQILEMSANRRVEGTGRILEVDRFVKRLLA